MFPKDTVSPGSTVSGLGTFPVTSAANVGCLLSTFGFVPHILLSLAGILLFLVVVP